MRARVYLGEIRAGHATQMGAVPGQWALQTAEDQYSGQV